MNLSLSPEQFAAEGVALVRGLVPESLLGSINGVMRAQAARVMAALGNRPIGIGSRNGYHELVQRSPGRFDVRCMNRTWCDLGAQGSMAAEVPGWAGSRRAWARSQAVLLRVVFSRPGSPAQQWHIDSPHEGGGAEGRTRCECAGGAGRHPAGGRPDRGGARHAPADEPSAAPVAGPRQPPVSVRVGKSHASDAASTRAGGRHRDPTCRAGDGGGDCLIFDDRILHRGLANGSQQERWVAYFSYLRPRPGLEQIADTHFEASRSLFGSHHDDTSRPRLRARAVSGVAEPSLARFSHFENAGGSFACRPVIDALDGFYRRSKVQPYYPYEPSHAAGMQMDRARQRLAAWLNVDVDELHLGPSTSQNTYVLANAFRRYLQPGDEIVVTNQDHEANIGAWVRLRDEGIIVRTWEVDAQGTLRPERSLPCLVRAPGWSRLRIARTSSAACTPFASGAKSCIGGRHCRR